MIAKHFDKHFSRFRRLVIAALCALAVSACGIYKINIVQGNFVDPEKVEQVEAGMTRNQVKFLLGTPMLADSFHDDRWDYIFYIKNGRTGRVTNRKVTVLFDGDKVREVVQEEPTDTGG